MTSRSVSLLIGAGLVLLALLAVFVWPTPYQYSDRPFLSDDDGRTFPHKLLLDARTTSYPDGTETADGSLYIIYDQLRYTRGAQQIVFAKITEADILAGKIVTPTSRLAQKINRLADHGGGVDDKWEAEEKVRSAARAKKRAAAKANAANTAPKP